MDEFLQYLSRLRENVQLGLAWEGLSHDKSHIYDIEDDENEKKESSLNTTGQTLSVNSLLSKKSPSMQASSFSAFFTNSQGIEVVLTKATTALTKGDAYMPDELLEAKSSYEKGYNELFKFYKKNKLDEQQLGKVLNLLDLLKGRLSGVKSEIYSRSKRQKRR